MKEEILRSAMLLTPEGTLRLKNSNVIVFGLGGVGSYAAEALVRAGVGRLTVVDNDTVALSNINRQLIALHSTVGEYKTDAFARRALDINPELELTLRRDFVLQENINGFEWSSYDYAVDAVDTVQAKLAIAQACARHGVPLISCMGTGNKLEPERLQICDISKTRYCPLARVMRAEKVSEQHAARMPLNLLATMLMPTPVPQTRMPQVSASAACTARATAAP